MPEMKLPRFCHPTRSIRNEDLRDGEMAGSVFLTAAIACTIQLGATP
jgi:hypothetical protein